MNFFALLSLFSSIVVFSLGGFIFLRNTQRTLNRIFMLLCLSLALWSFTEFAYRQTDSLDIAYFWLRVNAFVYLVPPLSLHFMLVFTEESKQFGSRLAYLFMYAPAVMFIVLSLTTDTMGGAPAKEYWGWTYTMPEQPLLYNISQFWSYGLGILALYLCLLCFLREKDNKKKQQAKFIFIGFLVVTAIAIITEWLLPLLQITVPESTTISFTFACLCAGYAIGKYELFALPSATVAEGIISTMPDSLILVGPDDRITMANNATLRMLGWNEDELIGRNVDNIISGDDQDIGTREGEKSGGSNDKSIVGTETTYVTSSGRHIPVFQSRALMKDRDGKLQGTIYIGRDITELKAAEDEKKRMEEQLLITGRLAAVGELSAGVAHELNNPLAAIQAYAQFLASNEELDEDIKCDVDTIYKEAKRATRITSSLLSFARRNQAEKHLCSINEILEKSLELHKYRMNINGIEVWTELDVNIPTTMADPHQMQQVFVNLIVNAEQAMTEAYGRGKLHIKTQTIKGEIQVTFTDNGPGISEEYLKCIFDPFFTTKDVGKGTGLGLSICYGIIDGHGGRIYARSKPGTGATFVVEIPVVSEGREDAAIVDQPDIAVKTVSPRCALD